MKKSRLEKIFALLLVLTMQTIYVKFYNSAWDIILNALLVFVGLMLVLKNGVLHISTRLLQRILTAWGVFLLIPICHVLFLGKLEINYYALLMITVMCTLLFTICIVYFSEGENRIKLFLDNLSDAVYSITIISLFLYFSGQVFHLIKPTNTVTIMWGGMRTTQSYFNLLFTPQAYGGYHSFQNGRFTGIFTEAPMCSFMLCVALLIMLFVSDRKVKLLRVGVICIAIYATVSATGYIIATMAVSSYFLLQKARSKVFRILKILLSGFIVSGVVFFVMVLYKQKMSSDVLSVTVRSDNFERAVRYFLNSPIFGYGFKSDSMAVTGGDTSVFSQVLQQGGIIFAVWYFLPILKVLIRFVNNKEWKYVVAVVLYVTMLYVTVVTYTGLSITFVAMFFAIAELYVQRDGRKIIISKKVRKR